MQNDMYVGKEKRMALIEELLTVSKIKEKTKEEKEEVLRQTHEQRIKNAVLENIQGKVIS